MSIATTAFVLVIGAFDQILLDGLIPSLEIKPNHTTSIEFASVAVLLPVTLRCRDNIKYSQPVGDQVAYTTCYNVRVSLRH
jgi:hypothetical protein